MSTLPTLRLLLAAWLTVALVRAEGESLARPSLLQFREASGRMTEARTPAEWQLRRAEILAAAQTIMGRLPGPEKRVALEVKIETETDCGTYVRREISYAAEPGARVPAFLLLPKAVRDGRAVRPGVLALMPTNRAEGNRPVVGLGSPQAKPNRNYGEELALRGFVVLAPPYPQMGSYQPDLKQLGYAGGTMKAIWDNIRGLDVLAATPGVAAASFGAIGHSLGGHNAIFTAVFDERIKVVVSSCGFDSFLAYFRERGDTMWQPGKGWAQELYMPKLADYAGRLQAIPFDFHELIGALAPRAFFALSPLHDANFKSASVDQIMAAVRPVYALHGASDRLAVAHPDCDHDFPPAQRAEAYAWLERFLGQ